MNPQVPSVVELGRGVRARWMAVLALALVVSCALWVGLFELAAHSALDAGVVVLGTGATLLGLARLGREPSPPRRVSVERRRVA